MMIPLLTPLLFLLALLLFRLGAKFAPARNALWSALSQCAAVLYLVTFVLALLEATLRYQVYPPSSYTLVLVEGENSYTTKLYIPFIYDRLRGEVLIKMAYRGRNHTSASRGEELNDLLLLDAKAYNFRKGDFRLNHEPNYVLPPSAECASARNTSAECTLSIRYNNKTIHFQPRQPDADARLREISANGTYYAYAFSDFKSFFKLSLSIKRDDEHGVIYLVRDPGNVP